MAKIASNASVLPRISVKVFSSFIESGVEGCEVSAKRCEGFALGVTVVGLTHQAVKTDGREFPSTRREKACRGHGVQ